MNQKNFRCKTRGEYGSNTSDLEGEIYLEVVFKMTWQILTQYYERFGSDEDIDIYK